MIIFHAFPYRLNGGFIGVDIFFVISGFLISTIIFENLKEGTFDFYTFYSRRIKRIFPALIVVLIATFSFGWFVLLSDEYAQLGKHIFAGAGFFSNFIFWSESGYFDNISQTKPLIHLWSLGVEEQFYIVWPILLWFFWKKKFSLLLTTLILFVASFILNIKIIQSDSIQAFYSPITRFWELLSGGLLAWYLLNKKEQYKVLKQRFNKAISNMSIIKMPRLDFAGHLASLFGFAMLIYGLLNIKEKFLFPGLWALVPVLGTVLLILAGPNSVINRFILSKKILIWIGLISYPLYLWHWPIFSFAYIMQGEMPSTYVRIILIISSVVLAWITYELIERPIRRAQYTKNKMIITVLILGILSVGSIGYYVQVQDGMLNRPIVNSPQQMRKNILNNEVLLKRQGARFKNCNLSKNAESKVQESFVKNWSCFSDDENLIATEVLIFGNSHAADKAVSLRLNGINAGQITGSACTVNPKLSINNRRYCNTLFYLFNSNKEKFKYIFVIDSFSKSEVTKERLSEILEYWSGEKPVYIFTPMPRFDLQAREYLKSGDIFSEADFSLEDMFYKNINELKIPDNIKIIKTSELWCKDRLPDKEYPCSFVRDGKLLMIDGGHLSIDGAKIMGKNMLNHPILSEVLR